MTPCTAKARRAAWTGRQLALQPSAVVRAPPGFHRRGGEIVAERKNHSGKGDTKDFRGRSSPAIRATHRRGRATGFYAEAALICIQAATTSGIDARSSAGRLEVAAAHRAGGPSVENTYDSTYSRPKTATRRAGVRPALPPPAGTARRRSASRRIRLMTRCASVAAAMERAGTTDSAKLRDTIAATRNSPA